MKIAQRKYIGKSTEYIKPILFFCLVIVFTFTFNKCALLQKLSFPFSKRLIICIINSVVHLIFVKSSLNSSD